MEGQELDWHYEYTFPKRIYKSGVFGTADQGKRYESFAVLPTIKRRLMGVPTAYRDN
jgi:hypothetical protein